MQKRKLLVICGPTATGKTKLGIELAKKFDGEIISADSRQVYKGMDIGTGKDIQSGKFQISNVKFDQSDKLDKFRLGFYEINGVKIWLYDIVEPDYRFNVADYVKCADLVIDDIYKRGKLPIIIGGTGLYIKALVDGIETIGIKPDRELRERLSNYSIVKLLDQLKKLNPKKLEQMNNSDRNNPRRLVRAIEIALSPKDLKLPKLPKDVLFIGLSAPQEILYERIDKRVDERIKQGIEKEIEQLFGKGYNFKNSVLGTTIGYREWSIYKQPCRCVSNNIYSDVIGHWKHDEHGYARRQMTWFKKDKRIRWFNIEENELDTKVEFLVKKWYTK